ncbi:putative Phage protein [Vibrio phage 137E35-1]|nr:putative Phage protein [Vibrio phage 137E35-1]CAH9016593.1 putative Phage protein [Vibrio phage 230E39-1]
MIFNAIKKPVQIQAMQFTGNNQDKILSWLDQYDVPACATNKAIYIGTPEGDMTASAGDYIIKCVQDEFYPCKPDIFAATYDFEHKD